MKKNNRWLSPQSLLVASIISLLFVYMIFDAFLQMPRYNDKVDEVKRKYDTLSTYLDRKIPEIDSTLNIHSIQIKKQSIQIDELNRSLDSLIK